MHDLDIKRQKQALDEEDKKRRRIESRQEQSDHTVIPRPLSRPTDQHTEMMTFIRDLKDQNEKMIIQNQKMAEESQEREMAREVAMQKRLAAMEDRIESSRNSSRNSSRSSRSRENRSRHRDAEKRGFEERRDAWLKASKTLNSVEEVEESAAEVEVFPRKDKGKAVMTERDWQEQDRETARRMADPGPSQKVIWDRVQQEHQERTALREKALQKSREEQYKRSDVPGPSNQDGNTTFAKGWTHHGDPSLEHDDPIVPVRTLVRRRVAVRNELGYELHGAARDGNRDTGY
jgi:hypothetical protein